MSDHSVEAYIHDVEKLIQYLSIENQTPSLHEIDLKILQGFIAWLHGIGMSATSQARIISEFKSFL